MKPTTWRKSTRCNGSTACVEVAWRTSTHCDDLGCGDCVQVGPSGPAVLLRDSADPTGPVYALTRSAFGALLERIKGDR